jgi:hypothetical protein
VLLLDEVGILCLFSLFFFFFLLTEPHIIFRFAFFFLSLVAFSCSLFFFVVWCRNPCNALDALC